MIGLPFATLGVAVARRRPEQQLGWLLGIGVVEGAMFATGEAAAAMFDLHGASVTVAATSWAYSVLNWIALGGLATVLVLFPTGRPASPWSRYVLWALGASVLFGCIERIFSPAYQTVFPGVGNPFGFTTQPPVVSLIVEAGLILFPAGIVGGVGALLVRFLQARGVERQQLKVFFYAVTLGIAGFLAPSFLRLPAIDAWMETETGAALRWSFLPVAAAVGIGVAILRHGLYDIDRIIRRTIVYTGVTSVLGLGYGCVVLVTGQLLGSDEDLPSWVIAATTLTAAAVFRPIRHAIQTRVERHFNRPRYDMRRTIETFNARLRYDAAQINVYNELVTVIEATMQPTMTMIWLAKTTQIGATRTRARERGAAGTRSTPGR